MNMTRLTSLLVAALLPVVSSAQGFIRWTDFNEGLPADDPVKSLAFINVREDIALAATKSGALWQRSGAATQWTKSDALSGVSAVIGVPDLLGHFCAATQNGLWQSDDGVTWKQIGSKEKGMADDAVTSVAVNMTATPGTVIYLTGHPAGNRISKGNSNGWETLDLGTEMRDPLVFFTKQTLCVVSRQEQKILYTEIDGKTWHAAQGDTEYFTGALPVAQSGDTLLIAKHHGLSHSVDGGKTWKFTMGEHARVIGAAENLFLREGDRARLRGLKDRPLTLQMSADLGNSWQPANFGLFEAIPASRRAALWIPEEKDPYAHIRIATAFGTNARQRTMLLALDDAGVVKGEWMWTEKPPIIAGAKLAPKTLRVGDTKTKLQLTVAASDKRGKVAKVTADLGAIGAGEIELFDDGAHGDGAANDKIYGNTFSIPPNIGAGEKVLGVIATTDDKRVGSTAVTLTIADADSKITIWNGEQFSGGYPWIAPQAPLNYFKTQTEEKRSGGTAMEFRGEGGGWIGGGWNWHGWWPDNAGTDVSGYANLAFWMKLEGDHPGSLNVKLNCSSSRKPSTAVSVFDYTQGEADLTDGQWHEIIIPLADLLEGDPGFDPAKAWEFDVDSWAPNSRAFSVYIDDLGFDNRFVRSKKDLVIEAIAREPKAVKNPARVVAEIDLNAKGIPVSPYIYGAAMGDRELGKQAGLTILRSGGNPLTPHNWRTGFSGKGADWFYQNDGKPTPPEQNWLIGFHAANAKAGLDTYMSIPTMGRVAKDNTSVAFDTNKYPDQDDWAGRQQPTDPRPTAGSGRRYVRGADGEIVKDANNNPKTELIEPDVNDTSIAVTPDEQTEILSFMVDKMKYGTADKGGIKFIALDNEPCLWNSTHRGMFPHGLTYDAFWEMTENYASRLKKIDPSVKVAGPTWWGWSAYFTSANDAELCSAGKADWASPPDRAAHNNEPITVWWLKKLAEHKAKTGVNLVDVLDFHFYPQTGIYMGGQPNDPATMELRVQQTRVLWDPDYKDVSWMAGDHNGKTFDGKLQIIRMFKKWIADHNPGMQLAIGEYNFGGEKDVSGGVAQAELLGVFAREGVDHAYLWFFPQPNSPIYFGYKMLRNPDGAMTAVGGDYLPAKISAQDDVSVHTFRDAATKRLSFVLVNKRAAKDARVALNLTRPIPEQTVTPWEYSAADRYAIGQLPAQKVSGKTLELDLPAMSVVRVDVKE